MGRLHLLNAWFRDGEPSTGLESFYFEDVDLIKKLKSALESRRHVLLYGAPRQGKTALVRHVLGSQKSITLHASEDFGFADISRNILLSLGCSVIVEQKKKRRAAAKAEVKFSWPFISGAGSAEAGLENEQTLRTFTAEIGNPNDVCHLLTQFSEIPLVVIEHCERLRRKDRRLLGEFLQVTSENKAIQILLIASSLQVPLEYRERIELSRVLTIVHKPLMSKEMTGNLMAAALNHLRCPLTSNLIDLTYDRFGGALETTIEVCSLIASRPSSLPLTATGKTALGLENYLSLEFQQRSRMYLLALISAVVEAEWTMNCSSRRSLSAMTPADASAVDPQQLLDVGEVDEDLNEADSEPDDDDVVDAQTPILEFLRSDNVFVGLQRTLSLYTQSERMLGLPSAERESLSPIYKQAASIGRKILQCEVQSEATRLLAFAVSNFAAGPLRTSNLTYVAAHDDEVLKVNLGIVIIKVLLSADLNQVVVLNNDILNNFLQNYELVSRSGEKGTPIRKLGRRLRRLQRALYVDPPLFRFNQNRSEITLWEPANISVFGDIKRDLEDLLDDADENHLLDELAS